MNPLTLTVESVHSINTERGVVGVVTLTGDIETVRAIGGMLLQEVVVSRGEPLCALCGGPIVSGFPRVEGPMLRGDAVILRDGDVAHHACLAALEAAPEGLCPPTK